MHVGPRGLRKEKNSDEAEGKRFGENSVYLWNFYKKTERRKVRKKLVVQNKANN
jgi:hypothetical protein